MMFVCDQCGECCRHLDLSPLYQELNRGDGICKFLEGNLCGIYESRPLLCRIDESFDLFFQSTMSRDEYYKRNYDACHKMKNHIFKERSIMPLPLILGAAAAVAGLTGVGTGIHGAVKMKEANDTMKSADSRHKRNLAKFEDQNKKTNRDMDKLGSLELKILKSFETFSEVFEKIQNKPEFKEYQKNGVKIPKYDGEELKKVSIGAGVLLGGIGGAALGTAGGFAAAGATTAAVMALGTASTGTAIASLSGAAATNATLAALGGGAIAAGGGGIALGTTILGAATLGVGLLVGGVIFNFTGSSLSNKADEAWSQMKRAEAEIDKACTYMCSLSSAAVDYTKSLDSVNRIYQAHLKRLQNIVNDMGKTDWNEFTQDERLCTENSVLLVGLLYNMCKVQLVQKAANENELNKVNTKEINKSMADAKEILASHDFTLN